MFRITVFHGVFQTGCPSDFVAAAQQSSVGAGGE
jgi:hypothetical protein